MYLIEADHTSVATLRTALGALGDSLVVSGGDDGLWSVHVHVDDAGAAVEAGMAAGRPHRLRINHLPAPTDVSGTDPSPARSGRGVVAVSAGPGLTRLFTEAGARVVETAPGRRPSTAEVLTAILACRTPEVVVLPNDHDSLRVAQVAAGTAELESRQAAEDGTGLVVRVIGTRTQVQGLAALAVHDPGRSLERDVLEMTATARHARHGAVTHAARRAMTTAGPCEPGDVLGVVDGDFVVVGDDRFAVGTQVLDRLLGSGGDLVTLVAGAEAEDDLAARCARWVQTRHPGRSTWWSTTGARSATRSWCRWNEPRWGRWGHHRGRGGPEG